MEFMNLICPNSTTVWDGNGFSACFDNIVLGFGLNVVTVLMIAILGITTKNDRGNGAMKCFLEKVLLQFLPAFGVCMSIFDMLLLWKKEIRGSLIMYHDWLFGCSQFLVWATIIFFATRDHWIFIFCDPILSFWWIVKSVSWIPHLLNTFSSPEMEFLKCLQDSFIVVVDIMFSLSLNVIRLKRASSGRRKYGSIENPLLSIDMDLEDGGQHPGNSENCQTFWKIMTFNSVTPMMEIGLVKQLSFEDLLQPPVEMDLSLCHNTLLSCWKDQESNNCSRPSLFMAICHAYGWPYFRLGLLKVFNDCIGFVGPMLLNRLIRYLQEGSGNLDGYVLAISLGLTSILKSFLDTQYTFHLARIKLKLRSSIMTIVYRKCLDVSIAERSAFSEGEIQTFMSIDADRTVNLCNSFHDMWSLPLQIGVALYLLYTQVKFAFISGVSITILLIPVNKWISKLIASATQKMMKQKDERIRRTGEFLTYIRTLKMYGWESLFSSRLMETRSLEVTHLSARKYLDAWCVFFWATTPTLFSLFTFGLYALMGYRLDAATVFTCLALFNSLISPLNSFPWVINGLIDAFISMRRLSRLLSCPEHKRAMELTIQPSSQSFSKYDIDNTAIVLHDACCAWSSSKDQAQNLVLNHVSLGLPKGSLIAIIGEVGSGKSSLLNSILGEMQIINGLISSGGSISYVPQVPWILSGTIRDNILFGKDYNPERYSDVLRACALDVDISLMVGGDMVLVGEKGVTLSGGQRARLALARAIYHSADIFILDDVLSAVDAQVGWQILNNAILGPLMGKHTRVLCTHNIQAISSANFIVVMDKGYVRWFGSLSQFLASAYSTFFLQELEITSQLQNQESVNTFTDVKQNPCQEIDAIHAFQAAPGFTEVEMRKEGKVELNVYRHYAAFAGLFITFTICLSAILMQASRNGNDLWLSHWVDATTRNSRIQSSVFFYVAVLCIFCLANSLFTLVRAFSFAFGGLRAAVQMHSTLLNKLSSAPIYFFDQTPGGRILNRLSSDLYTIDDSLPFILNILVANLVGLLGIAVVLSYVQVIFLLLLLPFWYAYNNLQSYYRSTARELRRLDSVCRSPIYTSFTEALDGSTTIRAFNCEDLFLARFTEHVAMYQKTSYSELTASLWLSLRLQLLAAFVISFVAIAAVLGSGDKLPISFGSPGLVGLALSYAAPIVSLLGSFLSSFAETEKEMVSVERVLQYMDIPQEQLQGYQCLYPNWPYRGEIKFQNVTLKYKPSLPPALHKVTFTIAGGTQVGIVGRTGAGKSSVLNALFCLNPICRGSIVVDGINVADVSVRDLRSCFAVVPQSPFLFEGSLRENLDPFNVSDDLKIWKALEQCHMREEVEAAGGLDMNVKESGTSFSVGQRQLLCLARAFLKSSKVLCLDECTANIDTQTASILQEAISRECRSMTVVTIAHRISTVLNMDSVLIFDRGTLVEEANPQVLLQDKFSRFSNFAKASTM